MLDDLVELVVDLGGEIISAFVEHRSGNPKKEPTKVKKKISKQLDPWGQPKEKPVWEE